MPAALAEDADHVVVEVGGVKPHAGQLGAARAGIDQQQDDGVSRRAWKPLPGQTARSRWRCGSPSTGTGWLEIAEETVAGVPAPA